VEEAPAARRHLHRHAARLSVRGSSRSSLPWYSGRARLGTCHISKRHVEYHTSRDTPRKLGPPYIRETERGVSARAALARAGAPCRGLTNQISRET
jgi:hypothetical protein